MIDGKEYAKQMRENAVTDNNGNIIVSKELWQQVANIIEKQQAEIERLKNDIFCIANERDAWKDTVNTTATEAIKEFVQELKDRTAFYSTAGTSSFIEGCIETIDWYNNKIDEIVAEMVGADNGT